MKKLKHSIDQYRNIKGKRFICWTASEDLFKNEINRAKSNGLSYRVIDGQLYIEQKENK